MPGPSVRCGDVRRRTVPFSPPAPQGVGGGTDAAGGLDAEALSHRGAHEGDGVGGGAAGGVEAGGGLDEVGPGGLGSAAGGDDLLIGEGGGLDDDLEDGAPAGLAHAADVGLDGVGVTFLDEAEVDDHVDLLGALGQGVGGLGGLDGGGVGAGGEAADGGHVQVVGYVHRQEARGDAHAVGAQVCGLGDERVDLGSGGLGLEEGVVDEAGDPGARGHGDPFKSVHPIMDRPASCGKAPRDAPPTLESQMR